MYGSHCIIDQLYMVALWSLRRIFCLEAELDGISGLEGGLAQVGAPTAAEGIAQPALEEEGGGVVLCV